MNTTGIVQVPQAVLRTRCGPVSGFEREDWREFVSELYAAARQRGRVGVAAPQIGYSMRAFAAWVPAKDHGLQMFVNPRILTREGTQRGREGCLSVAERWFDISRAARVQIVAQDENGEHFQLSLSGLDARVVQHECDHLDGLLIVDRALEQSIDLPRQQRRSVERELAKVPR